MTNQMKILISILCNNVREKIGPFDAVDDINTKKLKHRDWMNAAVQFRSYELKVTFFSSKSVVIWFTNVDHYAHVCVWYVFMSRDERVCPRV